MAVSLKWMEFSKREIQQVNAGIHPVDSHFTEKLKAILDALQLTFPSDIAAIVVNETKIKTTEEEGKDRPLNDTSILTPTFTGIYTDLCEEYNPNHIITGFYSLLLIKGKNFVMIFRPH